MGCLWIKTKNKGIAACGQKVIHALTVTLKGLDSRINGDAQGVIHALTVTHYALKPLPALASKGLSCILYYLYKKTYL